MSVSEFLMWRRWLGALSLGAAVMTAPVAMADSSGVTPTSVKIGNIDAYSGPAAVYAVLGQLPGAYFKMLNDNGGIAGRKIEYMSYDDGYSPPKTVEQARKLVESDEVATIYAALGAPTNSAIMKYMNAKKVPQLFIASGATKFGDPKHFPWSMGFQPSYQSEGRAFAKYLLTAKPDAKIGILYQNDDFGRDVLKGFEEGLGDKTSMIVSKIPYETTDATIDSQVLRLKAAGADVFMNMTTPKFAAQAIRKIAEIGWHPMHFLGSNASSIASVLKPAGLENAKDIISSAYLKDPNDPTWKDDPGFKKWNEFLDKYFPQADRKDSLTVYAYVSAQTLEQVLKQAGPNLTRETLMKEAANLKDFAPDLLLPGIKINTSPTDYFPIEQLQLIKFNGERFEAFGPVLDAALPR